MSLPVHLVESLADVSVGSVVEVNGDEAHPLFRWLRAERPADSGEAIEWNFTKFLLDRDGAPVRRYGPGTTPQEIAGDLEAALAGTAP